MRSGFPRRARPALWRIGLDGKITPVRSPRQCAVKTRSVGCRNLDWNPISGVIDGMQRAVVSNEWPEWQRLLYPTLFLVLALLLSRTVYRRVAATLADEL